MISKSPDRGTFLKSSYIEKLQNPDISEADAEAVRKSIELFDNWELIEQERHNDPAWQKNNMEYNLVSTDWILEKVRASEVYSQNLYAAMCNNSFQQLEVIPILKDEQWSCSWRRAGGIVADMRQQGDYIDWYCSGIRNDTGYNPEFEVAFPNGYVPESCVTDEIRADLKRLGWVVVDSTDKF